MEQHTYAGGATWTVPASDNNFTLTAQWTTQTLSYSYDTNGGGTAPAGGTKTYGQSLVLEPSTGLSKTGYTFAGWNDGSTTHLAGATITLTSSKVFVAQWSAQSYSITYNGNGAELWISNCGIICCRRCSLRNRCKWIYKDWLHLRWLERQLPSGGTIHVLSELDIQQLQTLL